MYSFSPFTPWRPAPPELFVGRERQVETIRELVHASREGYLHFGFVRGEHGIGRSALASFALDRLEREDEVVGCHVSLKGVADLQGLMTCTLRGLLQASADRPWRRAALRFFGDRVRRTGLFGATPDLNFREEELRDPSYTFISALEQYLFAVRRRRGSLLLILDDIGDLARSCVFARWIKRAVDTVAMNNRDRRARICVILVGDPAEMEEMAARHRSILWFFEQINLRPWSQAETTGFFAKAFRTGAATISPEGVEVLAEFSGGFPAAAQEIGHAVWRSADGLEIENSEVLGGLRKAADSLAGRVLPEKAIEAIGRGNYRAIIEKLGRPTEVRVRPAQILDSNLTASEQDEVNRSLAGMKKNGILEPDPYEPDGYRFPSLLHAVSIWMKSHRSAWPTGADRRRLIA